MKMRECFKIFLSVLFFVILGTRAMYCQIQRQVNYSTITQKFYAIPSYIDEDSLGFLDWIYLEHDDDLERCTEQVINEKNELTVTNYYPQKPRWENDYQYKMGKSVTSKDGTVLYDHNGNEYYRLDYYNSLFILSQDDIESYGIYNDLFATDKEKYIESRQMEGYQVREQDGFIIATSEDLEIVINFDELIFELRFLGEEDNEFFAESGNKLEFSDRTNYTKTENNYVVPVKNTRVSYSTLPSGIPYEITEVESYLFYQVISENNTIAKMGNESIFTDCAQSSVTGIETIQQPTTDINIYPNPANEQITISLPNSMESIDIKVYNVLGLAILSQHHTQGSQIELDIHSLPAGIYVVRCIQKDNVISRRFVKL